MATYNLGKVSTSRKNIELWTVLSNEGAVIIPVL